VTVGSTAHTELDRSPLGSVSADPGGRLHPNVLDAPHRGESVREGRIPRLTWGPAPAGTGGHRARPGRQALPARVAGHICGP